MIEVKKDFGTFGWQPTGPPKQLSKVQGDDIQKCLKADAKPKKVTREMINDAKLRLPQSFGDLESDIVLASFPYDIPRIVPLAVAQDRGCRLEDIDFLIGGSALSTLASRSILEDWKYLAHCCCNGIIVLSKENDFEMNYADPGYQYKRFVMSSGSREAMLGKHDTTMVYEHLRLLKIGPYNVLVSAEIDAIDENEKPLKIRAVNFYKPQRAWSVYFQIISTGSSKLVCGRRRMFELLSQEDELTCERIRELNNRNAYRFGTDMSGMALRKCEDNIIQSLKEIKEGFSTVDSNTNQSLEMNEKMSFQLTYEDSKVKLTQVDKLRYLLPPSGVVDAFFLYRVPYFQRLFGNHNIDANLLTSLGTSRGVNNNGNSTNNINSANRAQPINSSSTMWQFCRTLISRIGWQQQQNRHEPRTGNVNNANPNNITLDDPENIIPDEDIQEYLDVIDEDIHTVISQELDLSSLGTEFDDLSSVTSFTTILNTIGGVNNSPESSPLAGAPSSSGMAPTISTLGVRIMREYLKPVKLLMNDVPGLSKIANINSTIPSITQEHRSSYLKPVKLLMNDVPGLSKVIETNWIHHTLLCSMRQPYENWKQEMSEIFELSPEATPTDYYDTSVSFLRFLHNMHKHITDNPESNEDLLSFLANSVNGRVDEMLLRSKSFSAAFFNHVLEKYPNLARDIHWVRKEGHAWSKRVRSKEVVEQLKLDDNGQTRLQKAINEGNLNEVKNLLDAQSNIYLGDTQCVLWKDVESKSALDLAEQAYIAEPTTESIEQIYRILVKAVKSTKKLDHTSALHRAVKDVDIESVRKLIDLRIDNSWIADSTFLSTVEGDARSKKTALLLAEHMKNSTNAAGNVDRLSIREEIYQALVDKFGTAE